MYRLDLMQSETTSAVIPIISAVGSVAAAAIAGLLALKIERLKGKITEIKAEKGAWLVYEYRARQRLYEQFDPLWFQFIELSEIAIRRIRALGREAKDGRSHYSDIDSYESIDKINSSTNTFSSVSILLVVVFTYMGYHHGCCLQRIREDNKNSK